VVNFTASVSQSVQKVSLRALLIMSMCAVRYGRGMHIMHYILFVWWVICLFLNNCAILPGGYATDKDR